MKAKRLKLFVIAVSFLAIAVLLSGSMVSMAVACTISQRWDFGEAVLGTPKTAVVNLILYVPVGYPPGQIRLTSFGFKNGQISPFKILTPISQAGIPLSTEQSVELEIAFIPSTLGLSEDVLTLFSNMPGVCGEMALCGTGVEDITTIDDVIRFFVSSVSSGALRGTSGHKTYKDQQGSLVSAADTQAPDSAAENRLYALRNMLEAAGMLMEAENYDEACGRLEDVCGKTDGFYPPQSAPDFAEGPAIPELTGKLLRLMKQWRCGLAGS